ncbi:MAG: response regulator [Pseudomonadales bacterium]|nr:response regulator [Pseudomonadales bacterium]
MNSQRELQPAPGTSELFREGWHSVVLDMRDGIQRTHLGFLDSQASISLWISLVMATFLTGYISLFEDGSLISTWGIPHLLTLSGLLMLRSRRRIFRPQSVKTTRSLRARNRGALQTLFLGLLWGSAALYLPVISEGNRLLALFMIGGIAGGGGLLLASVPLFAIIFIVAAMAPPLAVMFFMPEFHPMALGWILYALAMINVTVLMYASVSAQIKSQEVEQEFQAIQLEQVISNAAFEAPDISSAIRACLHILVTHHKWHLGHVYLKQNKGAEAKLWSSRVWVSDNLAEFLPFTDASERYSFYEGEGPPGMVMASGKPEWVLIDHDDPQMHGVPRAEECTIVGLQTAVLVPIKVHDGIGAVLEVFSRDRRPFSQAALNTLVFTGLQLGRSLEKDRLESQRNFLIAVLESVEDSLVACDSNGYLFYNDNPDVFRTENIDRIHYSQWESVFNLSDTSGVRLKLDQIPLYKALQGEIVRNDVISFRVEGKTRRFRCAGQPMRDSSGQLLGAMVSLHDVTDEMELQDQLRQSQKLEAVGQLTGGVAHDFNNLLTVIQGNLMLSQQTEDLSEIQELIEEAITASRRGASLTQSLLAFSRRQTLHPEILSPSETLESIIAPLSRSLGEAVSLKLEVAPDTDQILADENQLANAVLNLCINSRDAMESHGNVTIQVENAFLNHEFIAVHPDASYGRHVRISVIDNGKGISEENLTRAFDPFFTTKPSGQGSGLGLSMVYGFVHQSGGYVTISSQTGEGTRVDLYLPATKLHVQPEKAAEQPATDTPEQETGLILVIEDDASVRDITVRMLTHLGYQVLSASDEKEAVEQAQNHPDIDLILSDIILRGDKNGLQVTETVRKIQPQVKTLYISGYTSDVLQSGQADTSNLQLLPKPYSQADLAAFISRALPPRKRS